MEIVAHDMMGQCSLSHLVQEDVLLDIVSHCADLDHGVFLLYLICKVVTGKCASGLGSLVPSGKAPVLAPGRFGL